jgi:hypothetical protein
MTRHFTVFTPATCRRLIGLAAAIGLAASMFSTGACSSFEGSSEGIWTASYFENPDRVWNAIELALLELDYDVVTENRVDGVIRAESGASDDGTVIALAIDQVMRTQDQVKVYVKPSLGGDRGSADPDLLKAAAEAFLENLEDKLKG